MRPKTITFRVMVTPILLFRTFPRPQGAGLRVGKNGCYTSKNRLGACGFGRFGGTQQAGFLLPSARHFNFPQFSEARRSPPVCRYASYVQYVICPIEPAAVFCYNMYVGRN